jgi:hypothetical protein
MQLQDFAQVVRSKNAGPRRFTLDMIFRSDADYQRAAESEALTAEKIAPLYGVPASAVKLINYGGSADCCNHRGRAPDQARSSGRSSLNRLPLSCYQPMAPRWLGQQERPEPCGGGIDARRSDDGPQAMAGDARTTNAATSPGRAPIMTWDDCWFAGCPTTVDAGSRLNSVRRR